MCSTNIATKRLSMKTMKGETGSNDSNNVHIKDTYSTSLSHGNPNRGKGTFSNH